MFVKRSDLHLHRSYVLFCLLSVYLCYNRGGNLPAPRIVAACARCRTALWTAYEKRRAAQQVELDRLTISLGFFESVSGFSHALELVLALEVEQDSSFF